MFLELLSCVKHYDWEVDRKGGSIIGFAPTLEKRIKNGVLLPGRAVALEKGIKITDEEGNFRTHQWCLQELDVEDIDLIHMACIGGFGGLTLPELKLRSKILEELGLPDDTNQFKKDGEIYWP